MPISRISPNVIFSWWLHGVGIVARGSDPDRQFDLAQGRLGATSQLCGHVALDRFKTLDYLDLLSVGVIVAGIGCAGFMIVSRWDAFIRFLQDGRLCMSTMPPNASYGRVAVRGRHWTFAGSDRAAAIYTLIATARAGSTQFYRITEGARLLCEQKCPMN
jgi:hypothetical protein